jgi:putative ABC transport system permease protein
MRRPIPLAWLQLTREPLRLTVVVAGVAFAVVLILMQLGFREALFESSVRYHQALDFDVALLSPKMQFIGLPQSFSRRRLYQARGYEGVAGVTPVYLGLQLWKNPDDPAQMRLIFVVGMDPSRNLLDVDGFDDYWDRVKLADFVLYDRASRPEFGSIVTRFEAGQRVMTELGDRRIEVAGLFDLGTSFGIDGSVITSDLNFLRLFPNRSPGAIDLGLVELEPGVDPDAVRDAIAARIPQDVEVLTRADFIAREKDYWNANTPIGYVFLFGVIMGLAVGGVIVYQILFSDVSEHLREYATLKAMGYTNAYLFFVVLQESIILALLGYVPGVVVTLGLYSVSAAATSLPLRLTAARAVFVLILTIAMCCISGAMALRKVRSADPAEVF